MVSFCAPTNMYPITLLPEVQNVVVGVSLVAVVPGTGELAGREWAASFRPFPPFDPARPYRQAGKMGGLKGVYSALLYGCTFLS